MFCDSVRIIEELEERFPEPSILPGPHRHEQRAFAAALQGWTDSTLLRCRINYISCLHADAGLLHRNGRVGVVAVHFARFRYEVRPAGARGLTGS